MSPPAQPLQRRLCRLRSVLHCLVGHVRRLIILLLVLLLRQQGFSATLDLMPNSEMVFAGQQCLFCSSFFSDRLAFVLQGLDELGVAAEVLVDIILVFLRLEILVRVGVR